MKEVERLTEHEYRMMYSLLRRYSETDMDQWTYFKFSSDYGEVFVDVRRKASFSDEVEGYLDVSEFAGVVNEK